MKHVKYYCDHCDKDLTVTGSMPSYRLILSEEAVPHNTAIVYSVMVCRSLPGLPDSELCFCGLRCLKEWLEEYIHAPQA